ncbi:hypothetical protein [Candidatus Symbiopectobacterium sp. NZEC135]|uniref:hypothetical protein n=1 Tax=Candidatus Symbiopectobacterium sp. NZEC135 TaxID=2820471 RepID=UPI0022274A9E|nr:hypothetical protein [Candidatus Symbiopectobacterium sp. NZEC135]MCW2479354.1 hypothetical protein [Candidatus Symbiopectobacterium sp. NZEC135]
MTAFKDLPAELQENWRSRVKALGLDPDSPNKPFIRSRIVDSIDALKTAFNIPAPQDNALAAPELKSLDSMSEHEQRSTLHAHVAGLAPVNNAAYLGKLEDNFGNSFLYRAYVAENIVVTASKPLIINSTSSVTVYGVVTLKDGGYIEISVPCHFQCSRLEKVQGGSQSTAYDISVIGKAGDNGSGPGKADNGISGGNGDNAKCNCNVATNHPGTAGADGKDGKPGSSATDGKKGGDGPIVTLTIDDLASSISLLNRGGNGGLGGTGGAGGDGGTGGNGGKSDDCAAYHESGGNGGNGGNGGINGNGGNGGNGGDASTVTVIYSSTNGSEILPVNQNAQGGAAGLSGQVGAGGKAGTGGGDGAKDGNPGNPGEKKGADGHAGNPGAKGAINLKKK